MAAEERLVERCIEAIRTQPGPRGQCAEPVHDRNRQACRRVHRQEKRDGIARGDELRVQPLPGQIDTADVDTVGLERGSCRREAEWLASEVVGRNQQSAHCYMIVTLNRGSRARGSRARGYGLSRATGSAKNADVRLLA